MNKNISNIKNPKNFKVNTYEEDSQTYCSLEFDCDFENDEIKTIGHVKLLKVKLSNFEICNKDPKNLEQLELLSKNDKDLNLYTVELKDN